jgi:hypothetical protein
LAAAEPVKQENSGSAFADGGPSYATGGNSPEEGTSALIAAGGAAAARLSLPHLLIPASIVDAACACARSRRREAIRPCVEQPGSKPLLT